MLTKLESEIRKRPLTWLALGAGTVAVALLARRNSGSQSLPDHWQKEFGRLRENGSHLMDEGARGAMHLKRHAENVKSSLESGVSSRQNQGVLAKLSNHESALAAFAATVLTKGVSSYFRWKEVERAKGANTHSEQGTSSVDDLEQMTVVQLRREAAEQEIEGRSGMKKDELVDALKNES